MTARGRSGSGPGQGVAAAWEAIAGAPAILEAIVDFSAELSVVTARGVDGRMASFPAVENRHEHHILRRTIAPAEVTPAIAAEAVALAERVAREIGLVGLLAVEMFLTSDGRLLVNELAPRPHNSGHWTIDACPVSQFEQLVRAICGLPLGDPTPLCPAVMDNLLGEEALGFGGHAGRAGRPAPSLRQERGPTRPQDGPRHAARGSGPAGRAQAMMSG